MKNLGIAKEIFKDIPNYNDYQISNYGNIKSFKGKNTKILKSNLVSGGYLAINLSKNGVCKTRTIHQLVAEAFLNHKPDGFNLVVNHKNFNRTDNFIDNLEIISMRDNNNHKHFKSTSKYTGVSWVKSSKKWRSAISVKSKIKHLGLFDTEEEANKYYNMALISIKNGSKIEVKHAKQSSKYIGVCWSQKANKWIAYISINKNRKYLGYFINELEAHNAYQNALKQIK